MAAYKLTDDPARIVRTAVGASIPEDPRNADWRAFQAWLAAGNTPDPADPAPPRRYVVARDILDKFSDADYAAMKETIAQNAAAARFYDTLLVRGEKPIDLDGERFTAAWGLIVQVLGQGRADAIMAALRAEATA